MSSSRIFARALPSQSLDTGIIQYAADLNAILEGGVGAARLVQAREEVVEARRAREAVRAVLNAAISANSGSTVANAELQAATAALAQCDLDVTAARKRLSEVTDAASPGLARELAAPLAAACYTIEQVIALMERAVGPLWEARKLLADHKFSLPRPIEAVPVLIEHARAMRVALGDR